MPTTETKPPGDTSRACAECGQPIPADARTFGLCPRCLMRNALGEGDAPADTTDASTIEFDAGSSGSRPPARRPFVPPPPCELAAEFPELEIVELLGQGGMGTVYKARQVALDRPVALKLFPVEPPADDAGGSGPAFAERFRLEGRVLARLNHPNIVTAHLFGQTPRYCYLVMEYVAGGSLRDALRAGPLPPERAVRVAVEACEALEYAHGQGIVHRDIKPENILLDRPAAAPAGATDGPWRVKVADFGLAKLVGTTAPWMALTGDGERLGTPHYAAPEQARAARDAGRGSASGGVAGGVDRRADLYSLGVVLYEMLTGDLPLGRFATPSQKRPAGTVDPRLDVIVMRCLEPDPPLRYPSAAELRDDLLAALAGPATAAARPAPPPPVPEPTLAYEPPRADAAAPRRATLALALAAAAVVIAAGVPVYFVVQSRHAAKSAQTGPVVPPRSPAVVPPPGFWPTAPPAPPALPQSAFPQPGGAGVGRFPSIRGGGDLYQDMLRRYGAARIATVHVENVPGDVGPVLQERLQAASGASTVLSSGSGDVRTIHLGPVGDLGAFSRKIDFGTVKEVDPQARTVAVVADPAKLPPPLKPAVEDPADPTFFERNLEDLSSWEKNRRRAAAGRLAAAGPAKAGARRAATAKALEALLDDKEPFIRADAAKGLAAWGAADNVPALVAALSDADQRTRTNVLDALASLKDPRGAAAVAAALPADRWGAAGALRKMGPVAEPAVLPLLDHADDFVRLEAVKVLGEIGTAQCIPALETAARGQRGMVPGPAKAALKAVRSRADGGPATRPAGQGS